MKKLFSLYFAAALGMLHGAEHWYEVRIGGQPSGYQHSATETLDAGAVRTTEEQIIVINRLGSKVEMKSKTQSVENAAGELVSVREETSSSQQTLVTEAELKGNQIQLRSTAGGNSYTRTMTLKDAVCGPAAFSRLTAATLKKPGDAATCRLYTPSLGTPYRATRTLIGEEEIEGQPVLRVKTELDGVPGSSIELLTHEGLPFQSETDFPFGKLRIRASDRETALLGAAGGELPAESFDRTMARSNIRFADARSIERIRLKLTHKKPELGWPALRGPAQTVIEKTPTTVILEVTRPADPLTNVRGSVDAVRPLDAAGPARGSVDAERNRTATVRERPETTIDEAAYLKPNQILQSDDPEVIRLAHEIARDEHDRFKAARKLQDWVAGNMKFDLGIAVVPASEVVRNRRGTCVAYSVLLASMARAVGIPSRIAGGFIYVGGIWGGHAWVEVLVDGQWLPIDAAGYRPGLADAARIQFDSYTAVDNLGGFSVAGLQMYANVDIEVLEYTIGGKTIRVPKAAEQHSVSKDEYRNPWLGFSIRKPESFSFAKLDAAYPDPSVLSIEQGETKVTVALAEAIVNAEVRTRKELDQIAPGAQTGTVKLDGREAVVVSSTGKARLVSREGESLWVVTAEGPDASGLLDRIAGGWKWISPQ